MKKLIQSLLIFSTLSSISAFAKPACVSPAVEDNQIYSSMLELWQQDTNDSNTINHTKFWVDQLALNTSLYYECKQDRQSKKLLQKKKAFCIVDHGNKATLYGTQINKNFTFVPKDLIKYFDEQSITRSEHSLKLNSSVRIGGECTEVADVELNQKTLKFDVRIKQTCPSTVANMNPVFIKIAASGNCTLLSPEELRGAIKKDLKRILNNR